jgi:hypothetical protein
MAYKQQIYYVEMTTGYKYAWKGDEAEYKGITDELGVKKADAGAKGLIYGASVKPPRVRITLDMGAGNKPRTLIRFCDPDKIEDLIVDESLTGKKFDSKTITSVRMVNG